MNSISNYFLYGNCSLFDASFAPHLFLIICTLRFFVPCAFPLLPPFPRSHGLFHLGRHRPLAPKSLLPYCLDIPSGLGENCRSATYSYFFGEPSRDPQINALYEQMPSPQLIGYGGQRVPTKNRLGNKMAFKTNKIQATRGTQFPSGSPPRS